MKQTFSNYQEPFYHMDFSFPAEIKNTFEITEIISIRENCMVCSLKKKLPHSDTAYILKRISKKRNHLYLYSKLSDLSLENLIHPLQEYHTRHFIYFIFPKLYSLSYMVKAGKMNFQKIEKFTGDISHILQQLHQAGIYHMDISPGNVFTDTDGHFYLGDFSSAIFLVQKKFLNGKKWKRMGETASTPGFYPETVKYPEKSPANYDIFGFSMILYLLFNQGDPPSDQSLSSDDAMVHQNFPEIRQINRLLLQTMEDCKTKKIDKDYFSHFILQLFSLFSEVKEQKITSSFKISLVDFENSLFCFFTEPVETKHFNLNDFFKRMTISKLSVQQIYSIPKSLTFHTKIKMPLLYKLLVFFIIVFLFSLYHFFSTQEPSQKHVEKITVEKPETTKSISPKKTWNVSQQPAMSSGETSGSSISVLPPETPRISLDRKKTILDISGQALYNTSFLSGVELPEQITVIFAEENDFTACSPFFSFVNIKELFLHDNMICSTKGFSAFQHLEILDLSENEIKDVSELSKLSGLKILDLSGQKQIKNINCIKQIKSLQYLILTNTNISKAEIRKLKKALPDCTIMY